MEKYAQQRKVAESFSARNEEIRDMFLAGAGMAEIARQKGLTRERVRQILKKYGLVGADWYKKDRYREQILDMYSQRIPCRDIAQRLHISMGVVLNVLSEAGITERRRAGWSEGAGAERAISQERIDRMVEVYRTTGSSLKVRKITGEHLSTIQRVLDREGVIRKNATPEDERRMCEMAKTMTTGEIARVVGMTPVGVYALLRRNGVKAYNGNVRRWERYRLQKSQST